MSDRPSNPPKGQPRPDDETGIRKGGGGWIRPVKPPTDEAPPPGLPPKKD